MSLTPTPLANDFRTADEGPSDAVFPLDLVLCDDCGHLQLAHVVDPETLYANYLYVSGTSAGFVAHFDRFAESVMASWRDGIAADRARSAPTVVEIGSNDGTLLKAFKARGATVQGVDPARSIAEAATRDGVPTIPAFFNQEIAARLVSETGGADIVAANNVCAHVDDLKGLFSAVRAVLRPDGLFVFEVSYRLDVIERMLFDTIYHEHLDYHAVAPLARGLEAAGLRLIAVERVPTHGGSARIFAAPLDGGRPVTASVAAAIDEETAAGLFTAETYRVYGDGIAARGAELRALLAADRDKGRDIAAYGAPAKATTLMFHLGLTGALAPRYIVDDSPLKQGRLMPGTAIPIVTSARLSREPPDTVLILAWNFADPILKTVDWLLDGRRRAIVPLPDVDVHT